MPIIQVLIVRFDLYYNVSMTQISRDDVQHLAQLSSLQLSDDETEALQKDIQNILKYIEQLGSLDTSGVEPTYQVTGLSNIWREDKIIDYGVDREALLTLAPDRTGDQVKVPKVL